VKRKTRTLGFDAQPKSETPRYRTIEEQKEEVRRRFPDAFKNEQAEVSA